MSNQAIALLKQALSATRVGNQVAEPLASELRTQLAEHSAYASLASNEAYILRASKLQWGGKRWAKYICFVKQNEGEHVAIAITQAKLRPAKEPTKCRLCGATRCTYKSNMQAMREAIAEQIAEFRLCHANKVRALLAEGTANSLVEARKLMHCPLSGKLLSGCVTHVDHAIPFSKLTKQWAGDANVNLCKDKLKAKANASLLKDWQEWHRQYATLQLVSAKANLSKGAKHQA